MLLAADRRYFPAVAALLLLTVLVGFAPTWPLRTAFGQPALPWTLHLHAAVLFAWFLLYLGQGLLIATRSCRWHALCGAFGILLGLAVVPAGLLAALGYAPRLQALYGPGHASLDRVPLVAWGNIGMLAAFWLLLGWAIARRRQPDWHMRLMLLASISIVGPALARFGRFPALAGLTELPFLVGGTGLLLGSLALHDRRTRGRLHPASVNGTLLYAALLVAGLLVGASEAGRRAILG